MKPTKIIMITILANVILSLLFCNLLDSLYELTPIFQIYVTAASAIAILLSGNPHSPPAWASFLGLFVINTLIYYSIKHMLVYIKAIWSTFKRKP